MSPFNALFRKTERKHLSRRTHITTRVDAILNETTESLHHEGLHWGNHRRLGTCISADAELIVGTGMPFRGKGKQQQSKTDSSLKPRMGRVGGWGSKSGAKHSADCTFLGGMLTWPEMFIWDLAVKEKNMQKSPRHYRMMSSRDLVCWWLP